jgi:hypothetical protein
MYPSTGLMFSKARQAAHESGAANRRRRTEANRLKATRQSAPRAWPLRLLRLGTSGSRA